ncbi:MAG: response regulator transcription factor [Flavipsychrobacter sp.]
MNFQQLGKKIVEDIFSKMQLSPGFAEKDECELIVVRNISTFFARNNLSERELEILQSLAAGETPKQIGPSMNLSSRTIEAMVGNIKAKLGCKNVAQLIKTACDLRLID